MIRSSRDGGPPAGGRPRRGRRSPTGRPPSLRQAITRSVALAPAVERGAQLGVVEVVARRQERHARIERVRRGDQQRVERLEEIEIGPLQQIAPIGQPLQQGVDRTRRSRSPAAGRAAGARSGATPSVRRSRDRCSAPARRRPPAGDRRPARSRASACAASVPSAGDAAVVVRAVRSVTGALPARRTAERQVLDLVGRSPVISMSTGPLNATRAEHRASSRSAPGGPAPTGRARGSTAETSPGPLYGAVFQVRVALGCSRERESARRYRSARPRSTAAGATPTVRTAPSRGHSWTMSVSAAARKRAGHPRRRGVAGGRVGGDQPPARAAASGSAPRSSARPRRPAARRRSPPPAPTSVPRAKRQLGRGQRDVERPRLLARAPVRPQRLRPQLALHEQQRPSAARERRAQPGGTEDDDGRAASRAARAPSSAAAPPASAGCREDRRATDRASAGGNYHELLPAARSGGAARTRSAARRARC